MDNLKDVLEDLGQEPFSYSGRGMFGRKCVAIRVEGTNIVDAVLGIVHEFVESQVANRGEIASTIEMLQRSKTDNLGRDTVLYWPDAEWVDDDLEDDGVETSAED